MSEPTSHSSHRNGGFGSSFGFIIACVGPAVGLGNIWMFPYRLGQYGGAAFLIPYLFFVLLFGWVGLSAEFGIGRLAGTGTIGAYEYCFAARGKKKLGGALSWLPLMGSLGIAIGYAVILGWVLNSLAGFVSGQLMSADPAPFFQAAASSMGNPVWHTAVVAVVCLVLIFGVSAGIERVSKVLMPLFFLLFLVLAAWVFTLPGAGEGYRFLFVPHWEQLLRAETWIMAMGQAFFTLSLGIGAIAVFGSYIDRQYALGGEALRIGILDTFVAFVAGLIIFPACSAFGVSPDQGASLIFITLPNIFNEMPLGQLWGALFFVFLSFAAMSTVIAVFENIISFAMDMWGWSRKKAVAVNLIAIFLLSMPCVLGFNLWAEFQPMGPGSNVSDLEDFIISNNLLPLGSLVYLLFCVSSKGWGWKNFLSEANTGSGLKFPNGVRLYVSYILPLIVLFIFVMGYWNKFVG